jgi:hypothetical protein
MSFMGIFCFAQNTRIGAGIIPGGKMNIPTLQNLRKQRKRYQADGLEMLF